MRKFLRLAALLISLPLAAQNTPSVQSGIIEPGFLLRSSLASEHWTLMGHFQTTRWQSALYFKGLQGGLYWKPLRSLKIGAFWLRAWGLRHDADWIQQNSVWQWQNTTSRTEDLWFFDVTPQSDLDFLPGSTWTGELKTRYQRNLYNSQNTLRVRPGLNYFYQYKGETRAHLSLQYELYFPLNYGVQKIYQRWFYQSLFWHFNPSFELGVAVAEKTLSWGSTTLFEQQTGTSYKTHRQTIEISLQSHIRFSAE